MLHATDASTLFISFALVGFIYSTQEAAAACTGSSLHNFTIEILLDDYPEESSWTLGTYPSSSSNYTLYLSNSASYDQQNEKISDSVCIPDGCYEFILYDSWGDGITDPTVGWYLPQLNGNPITFNTQSFWYYNVSTIFCTSFLASSLNNGDIDTSNTASIEFGTYGDFELYISIYDHESKKLLYFNDYQWDFLGYTFDSLYIQDGCYDIIFDHGELWHSATSDVNGTWTFIFNGETAIEYGELTEYSFYGLCTNISEYLFIDSMGIYSKELIFGCTSDSGCTVNNNIQIYGNRCKDPTLTIDIVETDYYSTSIEYVSISINNKNDGNSGALGNCQGLDADCSYDWVTCENVNKYNLTENGYFNVSSVSNIIEISLTASSAVNVCPYSVNSESYYLYCIATISCSDVTYDVNEESFKSDIMTCDGPGCSITKLWEINDYCNDATLTINVLETDFDSGDTVNENLYITVSNGDYSNYILYNTQCNGLNNGCTNEYYTCSNINNLDISSVIDNYYIDNDGDDEYGGSFISYLSMTMSITDNVTQCGYDNTTAYLYSNVTLKCNNPTFNLTIEILFGDNPSDISWMISEVDTQNYKDEISIIASDNGNGYSPNDTLILTSEIEYSDVNCYKVSFFANNYDDNGWYKVYIDDTLISHGKHKLDTGNGDYQDTNSLYFCNEYLTQTSLNSYGIKNDNSKKSSNNGGIITIRTYNFNGLIDFHQKYAPWSGGERAYGFNYTTPVDLLDSIVISNIELNEGCYALTVNSFNSEPDYWFDVLFTNEEYGIINETLLGSRQITDSYEKAYFCSDGNFDDYILFDGICNNSVDNRIESGLTINVETDIYSTETNYTIYDTTNMELVIEGVSTTNSDYWRDNIFDSVCVISNHCFFITIIDHYGDGTYHWNDEYGYFKLYWDDNVITLGKQTFNFDLINFYFCGTLFGDNTYDNGNNNVDYEQHNLTIITYFQPYNNFGNSWCGTACESNGTLYRIFNYTNNEILYKNRYVIPHFIYDLGYSKIINGQNATVHSLFIVNGCYKMDSSDFNFTIIINSEDVINSDNDKKIDMFCAYAPTQEPTNLPSMAPSNEPSNAPSAYPTITQAEALTSSEEDWLSTPLGTMITIGASFFCFALLLICCYHFFIRNKKNKREDFDNPGGVAGVDWTATGTNANEPGLPSDAFQPTDTAEMVNMSDSNNNNNNINAIGNKSNGNGLESPLMKQGMQGAMGPIAIGNGGINFHQIQSQSPSPASSPRPMGNNNNNYNNNNNNMAMNLNMMNMMAMNNTMNTMNSMNTMNTMNTGMNGMPMMNGMNMMNSNSSNNNNDTETEGGGSGVAPMAFNGMNFNSTSPSTDAQLNMLQFQRMQQMAQMAQQMQRMQLQMQQLQNGNNMTLAPQPHVSGTPGGYTPGGHGANMAGMNGHNNHSINNEDDDDAKAASPAGDGAMMTRGGTRTGAPQGVSRVASHSSDGISGDHDNDADFAQRDDDFFDDNDDNDDDDENMYASRSKWNLIAAADAGAGAAGAGAGAGGGGAAAVAIAPKNTNDGAGGGSGDGEEALKEELQGWEKWKSKQVNEWLNNHLLTKVDKEDNIQMEELKSFMEKFSKQGISGRMILKIKKDKNDENLSFIKESFGGDEPQWVWDEFKNAVAYLP